MVLLPGSGASPQSGASASPNVFASPVHAGCYRSAWGDCKIRVDPFTVQVAAGRGFVGLRILANGKLLYDVRADALYRPTGNFTPTLPKMDFAAHCNQIYTVAVIARDTGDTTYYTTGQTATFTCPPGFYQVFLPETLRGSLSLNASLTNP